jgi:site-specific DNA recombinase
MIFEYYIDPNSPFRGINGIALHLTDIKAPTKRGAKVWHRQVVRQILMNEAYAGILYQNRWDTVGNYVKKQSGEKMIYKTRPKEEWVTVEIPAIIPKEKFDFAQKLLGQGRRRNASYGKHIYLLSGLVRCGRCGCTMTGKKKKSHGKDYYVYECRKNYAGAKTKGCGKEMSENKLNTFVWENLIEIFNNPDKIKEMKEDHTPNYIEDELNHLQSEIEKTKKGRKRLFTLVSLSEDDEIDLEEIKDQIRDLQAKEKDLQTKYNQLLTEIKAEEETESSQLALQAAIDFFVIKKEGEFSFDDKQTLIRMAVKEILLIDSETVHIQLF